MSALLLENGSVLPESARRTQPTVRPECGQRHTASRWTAFQANLPPAQAVPGASLALEPAGCRATLWAAVRMHRPLCPEHQSASLAKATVQGLPLRREERKATSRVYEKAKTQAATGMMAVNLRAQHPNSCYFFLYSINYLYILSLLIYACAFQEL